MEKHQADLEAALETAEAHLIAQSEEAHRLLDKVKAQMTTAYNQGLAMF